MTDHRLGTLELVLGIRFPETEKPYAVPVNRLVPFPNLFLVRLGQKLVLIVRQGTWAVTAFDLDSTPYRSGFSVVSKSPIMFRSSDARTWNVFGVSNEPGAPERKLPRANSYVTGWYEWVSHSPDSEIVTTVEVLSHD